MVGVANWKHGLCCIRDFGLPNVRVILESVSRIQEGFSSSGRARFMPKGVEMFSRRRVATGLLFPLILLGANFSASKAFAQRIKTEPVAYTAPTLDLMADRSVVRSCLGDATSTVVQLNAKAGSSDGNTIVYRWTSPAGRIVGDGPTATWDLSGVKPGYYEAFVKIDAGNADQSCEAFASTRVLVECLPPPPACPTVSIICPESGEPGRPVTFRSTLSGGLGNLTPMYTWSISDGRITEGQGSSTITVDTAGLGGQTLTATLSIGGYSLDCSANCSVQFPAPLACRSFDEFPALTRNDEKARLDNFAIELQNDPSANGYVIVSPGEHGQAGQVQSYSTRIVDYLVNHRNLNAGRIITVVGRPRNELMIHLWICPKGSAPEVTGR
jgi:hypothetical protein